MNTQLTNRNLNTMLFQRRMKRRYVRLVCMALALVLLMIPALATGGAAPAPASNDALDAVENLSDFIFALIRAVGLILLGYGILQVGLSFQSHDPSQRSNGILTIAGGIIIVFTKEILNLITG